MSIYTVTIDHLMQLDKDALAYALRTFAKELAGMLDLLAETPEARQDAVVLADLTHVLTLRKVFTQRLEEMAADEAVEAKMLDGATALPQAA